MVLKCKNCNNGVVDGGSTKITNKMIQELEIEKSNEINKIDKKLKEELLNEKKSLIKKEYDIKINIVANRGYRKSNCLYCKGAGYYESVLCL